MSDTFKKIEGRSKKEYKGVHYFKVVNTNVSMFTIVVSSYLNVITLTAKTNTIAKCIVLLLN